MMKRITTVVLLTLLGAAPVSAMTLPPVPTEPIYFEPPIVEANAEIQAMSCYQLDSAINHLHPYQYTYKPDFYHDGMNKLATTLVVFDSVHIVKGWLGLSYLGYSALVDEKEQRRQLHVSQQIASLQRVKAEKHCYE